MTNLRHTIAYVRAVTHFVCVGAFAAGVMLGAPPSALAFDTAIVTVLNNTGQDAGDLHVELAGTNGDLSIPGEIVISPAGCPAPTVEVKLITPSTNNLVNVKWANGACVPNGGTVKFTVNTDNGPVQFAGGEWTDAVGANIGAVGGGDITLEHGALLVNAIVEPQGGGAGSLQNIGKITVTTGAANSPPITATFTFAAGFGNLDQWYDFRWINVITNQTLQAGCIDVDGDGVREFCNMALGKVDSDGDGTSEVRVPLQGLPADAGCPLTFNALPGECTVPPCPGINFPAPSALFDSPVIDGQPGQFPGEDCKPYYWTDPQFAGRHTEGVSSTFVDRKQVPGDGEMITFKTFLVIDAGKVDPPLPAESCWVLDGFQWTYNDAAGGPKTISLNGGLAPDVALIDNALDEGGPAGPFPDDDTEGNTNGVFAPWDAAPREDCPLQQESVCEVECKEGIGAGAFVKTPDACHEFCDELCQGNDNVASCLFKGNSIKSNGKADVPTVSAWGLMVMTLIGLTIGTVIFSRRTTADAPTRV